MSNKKSSSVKRAILVIGAIVLSIVVVAVVAYFAFMLYMSALLVNMFSGDEDFKTTPEEISAFKQEILTSTDTIITKEIEKMGLVLGVSFDITTMQIDEETSFGNSMNLKDSGGWDPTREAYIAITYQVKANEQSNEGIAYCYSCTYEAHAVFSYEKGKYVLDSLELPQEMFIDAFNNTMPLYSRLQGEPNDSPYYFEYHGVDAISRKSFAFRFSELSQTGHWDKKSNNFKFVVSKISVSDELKKGVIQGTLYKETITPAQSKSESYVVHATMVISDTALSFYTYNHDNEKILWKTLKPIKKP